MIGSPAVGDRVMLRGRGAMGRLAAVLPRLWCHVTWDQPGAAPKIVHLHELDKVFTPADLQGGVSGVNPKGALP